MSAATDQAAERDEYLAIYAQRAPLVFHNAHGEVIIPTGQTPTWVEATATGSTISTVDHGIVVRIDVTEPPAAVWAAFVAALVPPSPPSSVAPYRPRPPRQPRD